MYISCSVVSFYSICLANFCFLGSVQMEHESHNPSSPTHSGPQTLIRSQQTVQTGSTAVCPTFQNITGPVNVTVQTDSSQSESRRMRRDTVDIAGVINNHKKMLREKVQYITEYTSKPGEKILLTENFTNLWITEGDCNSIPQRHEVMDIEAMSKQERSGARSIDYTEIFVCSLQQSRPPRITLTKGLAGIGKTICVHKFVYDWSNGSAGLDFDFLFMFPFRELNLLTESKLSISQLVQRYYPHTGDTATFLKDTNIKCLFIFDGLDESRLCLDFNKSPEYADVEHMMKLHVLLVNLIKGTLLSHASVWITARPAAARQIPAAYIDRLTEIQGFRDEEKEEYFRKKCKGRADMILSNIMRQPSLFTMCYVPAFCWILATVLLHAMKSCSETDIHQHIPRTITEVYSNFLIVMIMYHQDKQSHGVTEREKVSDLLQAKRPVILNLGRLAFHCLKVQKLVFHQRDMESFRVDLSLLCDGFCKEILLQDEPIFQHKAYAFIHLTMQEYFAALYVFLQHHMGQHPNPLAKGLMTKLRGLVSRPSFSDVCKSACKKAVWSQNGHLDMFFRFLCGLSTEKNLQLLQGLSSQGVSDGEDATRTAAYIKRTLHRDIPAERCLNLFYCLNELNDGCIVDKLKQSLREGALATRDLEAAEYSAIAFVLQASNSDMEEFNIADYNLSDELLWRLLPVAKLFRKVKLVNKDITKHLVNFLGALLILSKSQVQELWLENTEISDVAMKQLCVAMKNSCCRLQSLSLSGTDFTQRSWEELTNVIKKNQMLLTLDLSYTFPDHSAISLLAAALKDSECRLQTLKLISNDLDVHCCEELASGLSTNQSLVELNLSRNQLKDMEMMALCNALKKPECKLQILHLNHNQISSDCCEVLSSALAQNKALFHLNLTHNKLGNAGVKILCRALKNNVCKLQMLSLKYNSLTYDCCEELAFAVKENSELLDLDISANKITDGGVKLLCQISTNHRSNMQCLRISMSDLSANCCQALASLLVELKTIKELHLDFNVIGDLGVKYLCWAFKTRDNGMEALSLKRNYLTDECCGDLVSALCMKNTLKFLDLSFNGFTDNSLELFRHLVLKCADLEELVLQANCFSLQGCNELEKLMNSRQKLQVIL
ncbi:NACHT, LRR and PYD domains-containing protein 3-like isoform X1 [Hemiscyllium ocellatum]|uniref:NACHT, LRR and PYD domains-containing protein 3-like isoform X1 n=2 Tax=Hemiscyllium ocellatum TaxID=170820 RepID=UPI0029673FE9|nr:NACHT, LRR and PYD domains-containing protein 3-like isoform X1 [Hemiscyllium ocellatum]